MIRIMKIGGNMMYDKMPNLQIQSAIETQTKNHHKR